MDFGELITAMVTPFDSNYKLDLESAKKLMQHLIENGSDSVLLSGTTGESPTLSDEEKFELFAFGVDFLKCRAKVISGTGSNDTAHSVKLSKHAEKTGVDCILVVTPYYNKPGQEGLTEHFKAIASAVSILVIIYNVPSRTACNISSKTAI